MFDLDPSQLPPEIAALIFTRGQGVPPLQWHGRPNPLAARTLGELSDGKLFQRVGLANEAMSHAVRSLLYLWNGLPAEATTAARAAPAVELCFVAAIAERQAGNVAPAKEFFRQVGPHPVFQQLAPHVLQMLPAPRDPMLVRFAQIVKDSGAWEPFLFVDLYEQTRAGKAVDTTAQTVCRLQCLEFEVFFRYCLETTLGEKLVRKAQSASVQDYEARMQQVRQLAEKHRAKRQRSGQSEGEEQADDDSAESPQDDAIRIGCPKCKSTVELPASSRGQCARCSRCGVKFMVPQLQTVPGRPAVVPPANMVGIRCPKCQEMLMFPEEARGKKEKCGKCGVVFLIPPRKSPATAPLK
jgi:hypothetical protein